MTIIELNIAGLHVTGSTSGVQRQWPRSCRAVRRSIKNMNWRAVPHAAAERPAA